MVGDFSCFFYFFYYGVYFYVSKCLVLFVCWFRLLLLIFFHVGVVGNDEINEGRKEGK